MPTITIDINEETKDLIKRRAKKNLLTLKEQIEEIVRKSALRTKDSKNKKSIKVDDRLVSIFSKDTRGRKKEKV